MNSEGCTGGACALSRNGDNTMAPLPENMVVAMAYVPFQQFSKVYTPEKALDNGTLFPELDNPFYGRQVEPR